jgi:CRP-like cAMP-binding protein/Fe-S-cluster-containing dehydrogenase component
MNPVAVCRVCVVELSIIKRGQRRTERKLLPACQHRVEPDMEVRTIATSERVRAAVATVTELLLTDHPSPCENQKRTGDCELEALGARLNLTPPRFEPRTETPNRDDSSPVIAVDHAACILCDRCIRGCNEVRDNHVLGRAAKGYAAKIAFDLDDPMGSSSCVACGECMISCPTGALTSRAIVQSEPWKDTIPAPRAVSASELITHALPPIRRAFRGVAPAFLRWNERSIVRRTFKKGEVICREGDFGSTAFLIESGSVLVTLATPRKHVKARKDEKHGDRTGRGLFGLARRFTVDWLSRAEDAREEESTQSDIVVDADLALPYDRPEAILGPGDIVGEMACMNFQRRAATVVAAEDVTVLEFLRNVLYIMQRSKSFRGYLDTKFRDRAIASHLRSVDLFRDLRRDPARFEELVDHLRSRVKLVRVNPGEVIVRQGEPSTDGFYLVRTGFVKVSQRRRGGEYTVSYLGPGGYFGEIGLLAALPELRAFAPDGRRTATCSAIDHVEVVRISPEDFRDLLERFPTVREPLVREATERLDANRQALEKLESVPLSEFLRQGLMNANSLLVLDLEKCTRCDECTKACADAHFEPKLGVGVTRLIREGLRFDTFLVASSCRSCLDPYCMVGCPVGSIRRRKSLEIIIEDWCIGCGVCAENCPYGNINMHPFPTEERVPDPNRPGRMIPLVRQKATTCDLCTGVGGDPSCVYACPHDAAHRMTGRELIDLVRDRYQSPS